MFDKRQEKVLDILMQRYGAKMVTDEKGERCFDLSHFDMEGFRQNAINDIDQAEAVAPPSRDYTFTSCTYAKYYREGFLSWVEKYFTSHGATLSERELHLVEEAYNFGFNDCGNMIICDILGVEIPPQH